MAKKWNIIHDTDTETGDPTCWSLEVNEHYQIENQIRK